MKAKATPEMMEIAERIAVKNGVSIADVLIKVEHSSKKTSFRKNDFFWGDSVITLDAKKYLRPLPVTRALTGCGTASR